MFVLQSYEGEQLRKKSVLIPKKDLNVNKGDAVCIEIPKDFERIG